MYFIFYVIYLSKYLRVSSLAQGQSSNWRNLERRMLVDSICDKPQQTQQSPCRVYNSGAYCKNRLHDTWDSQF